MAELSAEIAARLRRAPPCPHYAYTNPQVLVPLRYPYPRYAYTWQHRVEMTAADDLDRTFMDPDGTITHQPRGIEDHG